MKKGVILYVTEGKEDVPMQPYWPGLKESTRSLNVDAVHLAVSEEEIVYRWWQLLTKGIQQVSCMKASYNAGMGRLEPYGFPMRLYG